MPTPVSPRRRRDFLSQSLPRRGRDTERGSSEFNSQILNSYTRTATGDNVEALLYHRGAQKTEIGRGCRMEGPRACTAEDFEETMALLNSIFRAGSDQRLQTDYPLIFRPSRFRVHADHQGGTAKVVAHVPVAPREVIVNDDRMTVGIISPHGGTHPDYRHRGHGTRCPPRLSCAVMNENDWPVSVLWTREATFPFYQNSGYEAVGPQARGYLLNPNDYEVFRRDAYDISLLQPERNPRPSRRHHRDSRSRNRMRHSVARGRSMSTY